MVVNRTPVGVGAVVTTGDDGVIGRRLAAVVVFVVQSNVGKTRCFRSSRSASGRRPRYITRLKVAPKLLNAGYFRNTGNVCPSSTGTSSVVRSGFPIAATLGSRTRSNSRYAGGSNSRHRLGKFLEAAVTVKLQPGTSCLQYRSSNIQDSISRCTLFTSLK